MPPNAPPPGEGRPSPNAEAGAGAEPGAGAEAGAEAGAGAASGQMSVEEARELLDSAKSDEHHSLGVPSGPRDPNDAPEKAFKNW